MSIRTIAVDYHNTLPLRVGLERLVRAGDIDLDLAHPATATRRFQRGEYLLGLLPVAAHLSMPQTHFVGHHGIVARGFVGSVGIFSQVPLEEVSTLYLDHDSRSSVLLARILLRHHWRRNTDQGQRQDLRLVKAQKGYRKLIQGGVAGVIIGDPAIEARSKFPYYYDLGEAWQDMTGLPFVFAAWLSGVRLNGRFIARFDQAQAEGVGMRERLAKEFQPLVPEYNLNAYFTRQINYLIDEDAKRGLSLFLEYGQHELQLVEQTGVGQDARLAA